MVKASHNDGIDLLRVVSMLGVVIIHVLGHGGLLPAAQSGLSFSVLHFMKMLVIPAVDCFVMISGYVGYRGEKCYPRLRNVISLYFTVLLYSVSIAVASKLIFPASVNTLDLLKACVPIISEQYWFFTAYVGLILFSPLLNKVVYAADKKQLLILAMVLAVYSGVSLLGDPFSFKGGFSVIWFVCVYLLGAIVKKYNLAYTFSARSWVSIIMISLLVIWLSTIVFSCISIPVIKNNSDILVSNSSPFVVLMAVGWLCLFSRINCGDSLRGVVNFFSTSTFSVYLIHDNNYVRDFLVSKLYLIAGGHHFLSLILFLICSSTGIFVVSTLIDKVRLLLFRAVNVNRIAELIELFIKRFVNTIYQKFCS